MPKVHVNWVDNLKFVSEDERHNRTFMEASPQHGGSGSETSPMDLFLSALGGCICITIVTMLKAREQTPKSISMTIDGALKTDPPRFFEKITIKLTIIGDLSDQIVERVVRLTMTKLCPIAAMLGKVTEMSWGYQLLSSKQVDPAISVENQ